MIDIIVSCLNLAYYNGVGHAVAQLVEALRYKPEGRGFDWNFSFSSFRPHYGPGIDSSSNRNISWV
jgi:hypothetical protein